VASPRELLRSIREELGQIFLERDELIDGALVALLAAQHVLVIGPPGTAKSMLADEVCRRLTGARYFQWLLTRFTTPEELFGAVSLNTRVDDQPADHDRGDEERRQRHPVRRLVNGEGVQRRKEKEVVAERGHDRGHRSDK